MLIDRLFGKSKENKKLNRTAFLLLIIFSTIGLIASFVLSYEKLHLLENPNASISCSFNAVFNCANVMKTEQATVIGNIPNSFFGMLGFTAALSLSVMLLTGVKPPRWIYLWMLGFITAGWLFALWLFFNSVYVIQILCPWCLLVTASTTIMFFSMLNVCIRQNMLGLKGSAKVTLERFVASGYDTFAAASILFLFVLLIILKFRDGLFL